MSISSSLGKIVTLIPFGKSTEYGLLGMAIRRPSLVQLPPGGIATRLPSRPSVQDHPGGIGIRCPSLPPVQLPQEVLVPCDHLYLLSNSNLVELVYVDHFYPQSNSIQWVSKFFVRFSPRSNYPCGISPPELRLHITFWAYPKFAVGDRCRRISRRAGRSPSGYAPVKGPEGQGANHRRVPAVAIDFVHLNPL